MSVPTSMPAKSAAKPSLELYQIFENQVNHATRQKNEKPVASSAENSRLKNIHSNSNSHAPSRSEKILLNHEIAQNLRKQNELEEELKTPKQARNEQGRQTEIDHIAEIHHAKNMIETLLAERKLALQDAQKNKRTIEDDDNIQEQIGEIETLESSLKSVVVLLEKLSTPQKSALSQSKKHASSGRMSGGESSDDDDSASESHSNSESSARASNDKDNISAHDPKDNLKNIIIKRTTTKRRSPTEIYGSADQKSEKQPVKTSTSTKAKLLDDIDRFSNVETRKKITKIDNKIIDISKSADDLLKKIKQCKNKLDSTQKSDDESLSDQAESDLESTKKKLEKLEFLYIQMVCNIGRLYVERDAVGKPFLSSPAGELPDPEHIKDGIGDKTIELEKAYKKMLEEYKTKVNEDPDVERKASFWNNVAGAAAFGSSFFITNSATRVAQILGAPSWGMLAFAPIVSGALHTVVATPVAKQFMLRTWKSPVLGEMNNYFRLMGAYWHDQREGNLEEKKYASKDSKNENLLTIEERWKEERGLWKIFKDRLYYEENSYLIYSALYSFKSAIQTAIFKIAQPSENTAIGIDILTHACAGFASGAMYLEMQQSCRSTHPGNTVDVNPTREIHQAHADWLSSLRSDLKQMIASIEAVSKDDPRIRALSVKLHKTEVALLTAQAKAGRLSAFLHDFKTQFNAEILADTLTDMAGRIVSLYPTAVVNQLCATTLRTSSNPLLVMLSYILPALTLIVAPGFQARGLYGGIIRACVQSVFGADPAAAKPQKAEQKANEPEEDNSEIITISYDSSSDDTDESGIRDDQEQWTGRPSKRLEEIV